MSINEFSKEQIRMHLKQTYGFDFPQKAKYKRFDNRIYFITDFQDGEEIEFVCGRSKPSACAIGNVFYKGEDGISKLINIKEINTIDN